MTRDDTDADGSTDVPIACTLTAEEAAERGEWIRSDFAPEIEAVEEREGGYVFEISASPEALSAAMEFVRLEHDCCPFAHFELHVTPGSAANRLAMYGPEDLSAMLERGLVEPLSAEIDGFPTPT